MHQKYLLFILIFCLVLTTELKSQDSGRWLTYFEKSDYLNTPGYEMSMDYFKQIVRYSPFVKMMSIGKSAKGRDINCLIIDRNKEFTPEKAHKSGKAVILIEAGIHAGEIEGKDAGMLLLREMLVSKEKLSLLNNAVLLFIPVLNVDGHERTSRFNRINQNGPLEMGWRTTAQNLNLNRDFMKADAPEMQALLKLFSKWMPDFFIDSHTTDGADYQYTLTYSVEKHENIYPETAAWLKNKFIPAFENGIEKSGYLAAPYVSLRGENLSQGIEEWASMARLSTGYAALQNRPSLLIETHMLKTYKERVLVTKAAFEWVISFLGNNSRELKDLNSRADVESVRSFIKEKRNLPVDYTGTDDHVPFIFKGFKDYRDSSWITGSGVIRYSNEKLDMKIPYYNKIIVKDSVSVPEGYIVPAEWSSIVERMTLHGISVDKFQAAAKFAVERIKFRNIRFASKPYEGRFLPSYEIERYFDTVIVNAGDYYIKSDQRTIRVIANLLEPLSPDSYIKWGFFNTIFEQKEYFEEYSMEPVARKMAEENEFLKEEFMKRVSSDESFRNNPYQRLNFFYEKSPYFDKQLNLYPVMRLTGKPAEKAFRN